MMIAKIKICILGNSHVASLKSGWDLEGEHYPQFELTFFAQRAQRDVRALSRLGVNNNRLEPESEDLRRSIAYTSGGLEYIDPNSFDYCLIYGLIKPYFEEDGRCFSKAVRVLAVKNRAVSSTAFGLLQKIRQISDIPTFIGYRPLVPASNSDALAGTERYDAGIALLNEVLLLEYGACLLSQPRHTIVNGVNTKDEFCFGGCRLDIGGDSKGLSEFSSDKTHMNGDFGAHYLRGLFNSILSDRLLSP